MMRIGSYELPEAWHQIVGETFDDGRVHVKEDTNDDEDRGYPTRYARWDYVLPSVESFHSKAGKSRVGISGVRVTVVLDGEEI